MKNAPKIYFGFIVAIVMALGVPAIAQVMGDAAVAVAVSAQNQAQVQEQAAQLQAPPVASGVAAPAGIVPGTETHMAESPQTAEVLPEDEGMGDEKVPASVKSIVKRLDEQTKDVTLEDLNAAREAVAKLDVLIDIEKRLSDLTSIRQKREEGAMMGGAIPASALGMVGHGGAMPSMPMPQPVAMPLTLPEASVDLVRIIGASGHRVASIKTDGDKTIQVREGDKLSDDSVVTEISSRSITLSKENKKRTVKIKDVGTIFTGR